jgi:predicted lysophospholipase L1 biosynthesis ABC-type transport system permease subunit
VAVVNELMERRYFPGGAVGRRIRFRGRSVEIVGVVGDKRHHNLREDVQTDLYLPRVQSDEPRFLGWVIVKTASDPDELVLAARDAVRGVDPDVSIASIETMADRARAALAPDRFRATLIGALAGIALVLAAVGLYGLIAHTVSLGSRDIAIRLALGASARGTVGSVIRRVLLLATSGVAAGILFAVAGAAVLRDFLAGVTSHDPLTFVAVALLLLVVAVLAALGPALRASRIDPAVALRAN